MTKDRPQLWYVFNTVLYNDSAKYIQYMQANID